MDSNQLNITLKISVLLELTKGRQNVLDIGKELIDLGTDELVPAGFWIMDLETEEMYYSPNFRQTLGYANEADFPSLTSSYENAMLPDSLVRSKLILAEMLNRKSTDLYKNLVRYAKKNGKEMDFLCLGKFIYDKSGNPIVLSGSHHLIK